MTVPAEVGVASTRQDAEAVESLRRHHAELAGGLTARVEALLASAEGTGHGDVAAATDALVTFCRRELIPHAVAQESTLHRADAELPALRVLVAVMASEHAERLAAAPDICLTDLLRDLHADFTQHQAAAGGQAVSGERVSEHASRGAASRGGCSCGGTDEQLPAGDVRAIPHAIRHATVFGAIPSGGSLVLVALHDPLPLLRQLSQRAGGRIAVTYPERGPQARRLQLTR